MDVRAVIIVGGADGEKERIAGVPIAFLDVLGRPVVERMIEHLQQQSVSTIAVVGEVNGRLTSTRCQGATLVQAADSMLWRAAETAFNEQAQAGADVVLVLRLGAYTELNVEQLIQFHLDHTARVTTVVDKWGRSIDQFVISASRRNDAAFLFRSELKQFRSEAAKYSYTGYLNTLKSAAGFRQLAIDAFGRLNAITPSGKELRPGVWVGEGARIQKGARLLAPCFIGANARVRAHAVVTRCSAVERDTCIDFGSVIENSSILPFTSIGAGLDMIHSVVGFRRVVHLVRKTEVDIDDPKLVNAASSAAPMRVLNHALSLAAFLPKHLFHGFTNKKKSMPADVPAAVRTPSPALKQTSTAEQTEGEFEAPFIVARR